jgi:hypothetical protein
MRGATPIEAAAKKFARMSPGYRRVNGEPGKSAMIVAEEMLKAAISTGSLLPASAVADMRERWTQAIRDLREVAIKVSAPDEIHRACFDLILFGPGEGNLSPAGGDYVVNNGWRDISTAPRDGTEILWTSLDTTTVIKWPEYRECFEEGYWQPLPAPPLLNAATGASSPNNGEG